MFLLNQSKGCMADYSNFLYEPDNAKDRNVVGGALHPLTGVTRRKY
jgi:hypothetical protein